MWSAVRGRGLTYIIYTSEDLLNVAITHRYWTAIHTSLALSDDFYHYLPTRKVYTRAINVLHDKHKLRARSGLGVGRFYPGGFSCIGTEQKVNSPRGAPGRVAPWRYEASKRAPLKQCSNSLTAHARHDKNGRGTNGRRPRSHEPADQSEPARQPAVGGGLIGVH